MGRRTWIDSDIWYETRNLPEEEIRLYIHLLVNEGGNIAGYYKLNLRYLAVDMRMDEDKVLQLLKKKNKYWIYDEQTEQVLLPKYTKYNMVKGTPQVKKLNAELSMLTPCKLHKVFLDNWIAINGTGAEELIDYKFKLYCE